MKIAFLIYFDFIPGENKENCLKSLLTLIARRCLNSRKNRNPFAEAKYVEMHRLYHCAAYKTLACAVCLVSQDERHFNKFLFLENVTEGDFIWRHLIDVTNPNLFQFSTVENDREKKIKSRLVSIKSSDEERRKPRKYLQSESVFSSSLSTDVTNIDFSSVFVRSKIEVNAAMNAKMENWFNLTENSVNDHEIMATLCATVDHMFNSGICKVTDATTPLWLQSVCQTISDCNTPKNILIFLGIFIDNCRHWMRHFAYDVTIAVLKLLNNDSLVAQINELVAYLVIDLVDWNEVYAIRSDEEIRLATNFLNRFMKLIWHDQKQVFQKHMDLLKRLVEVWHDRVPVAVDYVNELIVNGDKDKSNETLFGLHLAAIILANDLTPWNEQRQQFQEALIKCLSHENVFKVAAEVIGLTLNWIFTKNANKVNEKDEEFLEIVVKKIDKRNGQKFLSTLSAIHRHYPSIVTHFVSRIVQFIRRMHGTSRRLFLEMFISAIESIGSNTFCEITAIGIDDLLKSSDCQLVALNIVANALPQLTDAEKQTILSRLLNFGQNEYVECRRLFYEIVIEIYQKSKETQLIDSAANALILGLDDVDATIRNRLLSFWSNDLKLPSNQVNRVDHLVRQICSSKSEGKLLSLCSFVLLKTAIEREESKAFLLRRRTEIENEFTTFEIDRSKKTKECHFRTPMFIETKATPSSIVRSILQSTADTIDFSPTIDPSAFYTCLEKPNARVNGGNASKDVTQSIELKQDEVILYRCYRFGDFPDFFIDTRSLLMPLQELACRDSVIARQTFTHIFNRICNDLSDSDKRDFIRKIGREMSKTFDEEKSFDRELFGAITDMILCQSNYFEFNVSRVLSISIENQFFFNGILLLESQIRGHTNVLMNRKTWIEVAKLYQQFSEADMIDSLFADIIEISDSLKKAIAHESHGQLSTALSYYEQCFYDDLSASEMEFAKTSFLSCVESLGDWNALNERISKDAMVTEDLWANEKNKRVLLPYYIRSNLRMFLENESSDLVMLIDQWLHNDGRKELMRRNFSEELILLYLDSDVRLSRYFYDKRVDRIIEDFESDRRVSCAFEENEMFAVRRLSEIFQYTNGLLRNWSDETELKRISISWSNVRIEKTDSLDMWESLLACRRYVFNKMKQSQFSSNSDVINQIEYSLTDSQLRLINVALEQRNIAMASSVLSRIKPSTNELREKVKIRLAIVEHKCTRVRRQLNVGDLVSREMTDIWEKMNQLSVQHRDALQANANIQIEMLNESIEIAQVLLDEFVDNPSTAKIELQQRIAKCLNGSETATTERAVFGFVCESFRQRINLTEILESSTPGTTKIGDAYSRFAMACIKYFSIGEAVETEHTIIQSVLRGMKCNSKNARLMFPRLLQLPHLIDGTLADDFNTEVSNVPLSTFLTWSSQIMSHFDFTRPSFLNDLVIKLSKAFPSQMMYPFQLAWSISKLHESAERKATPSKHVGDILEILHNPLTEKFIENIQLLCYPENIIKAQMNSVVKCITAKDKASAIAHLKDILNSIARVDGRSGRTWKNAKTYESRLEGLIVLCGEFPIGIRSFGELIYMLSFQKKRITIV